MRLRQYYGCWEWIVLINLTCKQKLLVEIIKNYQKENGYSPTITELCEITGKAKSTIFKRLVYLEEIGAISTVCGKARSIRVLIDD